MGRIAETLAARIQESEARAARSRRRRGDPVFDVASVPATSDLVSEGLSPLHARYVVAQHLASTFAEYALEFPIVEPLRDAVLAAEEEYSPSGPPMSPLTHSYFTTWVLFDLRFGPDAETLAVFLAGLPDVPGSLPHG